MKKKLATIIFSLMVILLATSLIFYIKSRNDYETFQKNVDLLFSLGLIDSDENIAPDDHITVIECLDIFSRIYGTKSYNESNFEFWTGFAKDYNLPINATHREKVIMSILNDRFIILYGDWGSMGLYSKCNYKNVLSFTVRSITDRTRNLGVSELYEYELPDLYKAAYDKGLISYTDTSNCDDLISRDECYKIIVSALNVEFIRYGGNNERYTLMDIIKETRDRQRAKEQTD